MSSSDRSSGLFIGVFLDFTKWSFVIIDHKNDEKRRPQPNDKKERILALHPITKPILLQNDPGNYQSSSTDGVYDPDAANKNNEKYLARNVNQIINAHCKQHFRNRTIKMMVVSYQGPSNLILEESFENVETSRDYLQKPCLCLPISQVYMDLIFDYDLLKDDAPRSPDKSYHPNIVSVLNCGNSLWFAHRKENPIDGALECAYSGGRGTIKEKGSAYAIARDILDEYIKNIDFNERRDRELTKLEEQIKAYFGVADPFEIVQFLNRTPELRETLAGFAVFMADEIEAEKDEPYSETLFGTREEIKINRKPTHPRDKSMDNLKQHFAFAGDEIYRSHLSKSFDPLDETKQNQQLSVFVVGELSQHYKLFKMHKFIKFYTIPDVKYPAMASALQAASRVLGSPLIPINSILQERPYFRHLFLSDYKYK